MLDIQEHTIRFWDSKLPGLSKQTEKGKTRFFSQNHINKLFSINNLLKNNDSLNLAFKLVSKNKLSKSMIISKDNNEKSIDTRKSEFQIHKIRQITNKLKKLIK